MLNITGCSQPCFYRKFSQVEMKTSDLLIIMVRLKVWSLGNKRLLSLGYNLILAASEVKEEEEHYIYDFISFISECGGSLGLFLGFSFFMVLDYLTPTLMIVKKLSNKIQ